MKDDKRLKRNKRMDWLKEIITGYFSDNKDQPIDKRRLIAAFCMIQEAPERTAKEMINILQDIDFIKINGNYILKGDVDEAERNQ